MGKWLKRLEEISAAPPHDPTAETDRRGVLSVLSVPPSGGAPEISSRLDVTARLLRWGWPPERAAATAARIAAREADDDRRMCVECRHYHPGRCTQHRAAGLMTAVIGPDLAALPQHCPAFAPAST